MSEKYYTDEFGHYPDVGSTWTFHIHQEDEGIIDYKVHNFFQAMLVSDLLKNLGYQKKEAKR